MNLWVDLLGDPVTILPNQTGWEFTIEPYPGWRSSLIEKPDLQYRNGSVLTQTHTRSDSLEQVPTLAPATSPFNYRTYKTKKRWRSVDAHFNILSSQDLLPWIIALMNIWT